MWNTVVRRARIVGLPAEKTVMSLWMRWKARHLNATALWRVYSHSRHISNLVGIIEPPLRSLWGSWGRDIGPTIGKAQGLQAFKVKSFHLRSKPTYIVSKRTEIRILTSDVWLTSAWQISWHWYSLFLETKQIFLSFGMLAAIWGAHVMDMG